jgi:glycosyltransferase involved in cell wall biosynthesis
VVIPTYNNQKTLQRVIDGVLAYTNDVIVINDGSTDNTKNILTAYPSIQIIEIPHNKGKGNALKRGFAEAGKLGFKYAITIDSDGQHYPDDLPKFIKELQKPSEKPVLLIGSRKMDSPTVPQGNSFGNVFSSWWVYIETGYNLKDTQCGYRLYPLEIVNNIKLFTPKFEFEIEIMVKSAWRGVELRNIPVNVLYDPKERVTHFRPVIDITRITLLNIWFVFVSFFFVKPVRKLKEIRQKGGKRFWKEDILKIQETPLQKAKAVALGVFIGISPFWGLHSLIVFFAAEYFKLNKVLAFFSSNVSIPPAIPFIIYFSYQTGALVFGNEPDASLNIENIENLLDILMGVKQYVVGSFVLAAVSALVLGFLFFFIFSLFALKNKTKDE